MAASLRNKIVDPEDAARLVPRGGAVAFAGMGGTAYSKAFVKALKDRAEREGPLDLAVYSAGTTGPEHEESLAAAGIRRRIPYGASSPATKRLVNEGGFEACDMSLYKYSRLLRLGVIGVVDVAVVEATAVFDDGLVLSNSVDAAPAMVEAAEKVVVEVHTAKPVLHGLHDIFYPEPGRGVPPLESVAGRLGSRLLKIPWSKLAAIVLSREGEVGSRHYRPPDSMDARVAENIAEFLRGEAQRDPRIRGRLSTLQPGAGLVATVLADYSGDLGFRVRIWGEVAPIQWVARLGENVEAVSASVVYSVSGDEGLWSWFFSDYGELSGRLVLRPYEVTNSPEVLTRFYHMVVQQAIEVDIYGHANVSHIDSRLYAGVGGSVDHAWSSYLTILALPSITSKGIPRIVPLTAHVDSTEHDVDVIVTEQGWADLRGLSPRERAESIIDCCAHPSYADGLRRYLEKAGREGGHQPYSLEAVLEFMREYGKGG
ncbi:acetyl-CoA hydrolase/transferase C-terminal domain-containing protein [Aeropyrum camini]|uniref:acetyl-CoA hydrolase/transferase C-terminal domain-containing protein n=1 Tax=Aeropyrum camini TaxID=229980 RepID=UPI001E5271FF|nr:acetyl-CoA hydrolase/transferase C-terminal domain-containing protein [Aeropyrum camini]